jgi:hypothetical protein
VCVHKPLLLAARTPTPTKQQHNTSVIELWLRGPGLAAAAFQLRGRGADAGASAASECVFLDAAACFFVCAGRAPD